MSKVITMSIGYHTMQTQTFQASARSSKLYAMKPTSSGNLGAAGIPGAETRGSTPPTPGMMTHNSLKKKLLIIFFISLSFRLVVINILMLFSLPLMYSIQKKNEFPPFLFKNKLFM